MTSQPLNLDALAAAAHAAHQLAPGPWMWRGNADYGDPALSCSIPGVGRVEVLSHVPVERSMDSVEGQRNRAALEDCGFSDEQVELKMQRWAFHNPEDDPEYQSPKTDPRLSFTDENHHKRPAVDMVTFEVARSRGLPDDTPRSGARIYRAEIVDVRHPVAQYMSTANPEVVLALIAKVRELETRLATATTAGVGTS